MMKEHLHGGDIYSSEIPVQLDYSANLNPLGMPEPIQSAIVSHVQDYLRYPDPYCRETRRELSQWEQLPEEWILCGNGASDLILRISQAVKPKVTLLPAPTFSEYEKAVRLVDSAVRYFDLQRNNQFQLDGSILDMLTDDVDLFFLCNPNNPTGQLVAPELLKQIIHRCAEADIVFVLDECFLDFTEATSCKEYLKEYGNMIILKAFTKMFSMAGLRFGYCMSSNIPLLNRITSYGQSWSVSAPAQYAAIAACQCSAFVAETVQYVKTERQYLEHQLSALGMKVIPGSANYIFFRGPADLWNKLQSKGVLIRNCGNYRGLDELDYRICVKQRSENEQFLLLLKEVL